MYLALSTRKVLCTIYTFSVIHSFTLGFKPCMLCLSSGDGHVRSSGVQPRRQSTEIRVVESVRFCVKHFLVHCCCGQCCQLTERALRADVTVLSVDTEPASRADVTVLSVDTERASRADVTVLSVDTEHHVQMSLCCQLTQSQHHEQMSLCC